MRNYDPQTGRFLQPDPFKGYLSEPASQNPYMYCRGNPVKYSDPSGYDPLYSPLDPTKIGGGGGGRPSSAGMSASGISQGGAAHRIQFNSMSGRNFQREAHMKEGTTPNSARISTEVNRIPDVKDTNRWIDYKAVQRLNSTPQLRETSDAAKRAGVPYDIGVPSFEYTKSISQPVLKMIEKTGGSIYPLNMMQDPRNPGCWIDIP